MCTVGRGNELNMTTLFDATFRLAGFLMILWESEATAQDHHTLTDTLMDASEDVIGGTLWMLSGHLAATAIKVTGRTSATVLTIPTQTADIDVGDHYALSNKDFPRGTLRRAVNEALRELAPNIAEDETLVTVAGDETYTLPTGVQNVLEVWQATETSTPYHYQQLFHWDELNGELQFPERYAPALAGYKLKILYRAAHEDLDADSDELPADVGADLVHWQAAVWAVRDGNMRFHGDPKRDLVNKMNEAQVELMRLKKTWSAVRRSTRPADW
jgi:hypothetical protein